MRDDETAAEPKVSWRRLGVVRGHPLPWAMAVMLCGVFAPLMALVILAIDELTAHPFGKLVDPVIPVVALLVLLVSLGRERPRHILAAALAATVVGVALAIGVFALMPSPDLPIYVNALVTGGILEIGCAVLVAVTRIPRAGGRPDPDPVPRQPWVTVEALFDE